MLSTNLQSWLEENLSELVEIRRGIHANPELGFEEERTSQIVAAKMRSWGIETSTGLGVTGVVGTIHGKGPSGRRIGLRADLDALPIFETTGLPYASTIPGKMHACGHDGHTAMLLGAAGYLAAHNDFAGTAHFIFQPAEESLNGAKRMIKDGLFDKYPCESIFGLHNTAGMPVGQFAICEGAMMAAADIWEVTFRGKGGHGGLSPHLSTDITYAQAHFVLGLQGIVGRTIAPLDTAVISVGYISGGNTESWNVVPSELVMKGTVRSFSAEVRQSIQDRMERLATLTADSWGCSAEFKFGLGPGAIINQPAETKAAIAAAEAVVGPASVNRNLRATTGSEDFADMMALKPGAFMRLGNGVAEDGSFHAPHTPEYNFNDDIIPLGIKYWIKLVEQELVA
jgi:amidohydrolase